MPVAFIENVNGHNIGVRKAGNQARLLIEALDKITISGIPGWKNFHRDFAVKILLARSIDMGHPSLTKRGQDFVIPKSRTEQGIFLHILIQAPLIPTRVLPSRKD